MPEPRDAAFQLHDNLSQHLACSKVLLNTLDEERIALQSNDLSQLERVSVTKASAAEMLRRLGVELTRLRERSPAKTMAELCARFPDRPNLARDWSELMSLAAQCQRRNQENAALLDARQQQVRTSLRVLRGDPVPGTYARGGAQAMGLAPRTLGSA